MDFNHYFKYLYKNALNRGKLPHSKVSTIYNIDYAKLYQEGVRLLIFDVDDTLTGHHEELSEKILDFLVERTQKNVSGEQFNVAIFSNCKSKRRHYLTNITKTIPLFIENSKDKPNPQGFHNILNHFNLKSSQAAVIGDRVGTDILGAHLSRIKNKILVEPYSKKFNRKKAPLTIRVVRKVELQLF